MLAKLASAAYESVRPQVSSRLAYRLFDRALHCLMALGRLHPGLGARRSRVTIERDVPYARSGLDMNRLDVYRPLGPGPWPMLFYVHGGSFSSLSKDTHWPLALRFAARGFLVYNINYRLAPRFPFPAALLDCCVALRWAIAHARGTGGDGRFVLAGESAGANLATALALCMSFRRPEPYAQDLFALDLRPAAVLGASGLYQVSGHHRLVQEHPRSRWVRSLCDMLEGYLADGGGALADPLLLLERDEPPARPLPPFLLTAGTRDPLLDDTRRLEAALLRRGVPCDASYYEGEIHAFHVLLWRAQARRCWEDTDAFLAAQGLG